MRLQNWLKGIRTNAFLGLKSRGNTLKHIWALSATLSILFTSTSIFAETTATDYGFTNNYKNIDPHIECINKFKIQWREENKLYTYDLAQSECKKTEEALSDQNSDNIYIKCRKHTTYVDFQICMDDALKTEEK